MASPVVRVESFSTSMSAGTNTVTLNLTLGQDATKCVPFVTTRVNSTAAAFANRRFVRARMLTGPARVVLDRGSSPGTGAITGIEVFVVEFDPTEVTVQQLTFTGSGTTVNQAIAAVDLSKTFVVATMRAISTNGDNSSDEMYWEADLSSTTNLRMRHFNASDPYNFAVYVVEDIGSNWDVQTVVWSAISSTQEDETITAVGMNRTFLVGTYRTEIGHSAPDGSSAIAKLLNTTTVRVDLPLSDPDERTGTIFVVECGASVASVQRESMQMTGATVTDTDAIVSVDLTRSMATCVMGPAGTTTAGMNDSGTSGDWDQAQCTMKFNSNVQVEGERGAGNDQTDLNWEVIEWLNGNGVSNGIGPIWTMG